MSIYRGFDWWVTDDFGDIWNEDPLPTFSQAFDYRNLIKPLINRITELKIIFTERVNGTRPEWHSKTTKEKPNYESGADF